MTNKDCVAITEALLKMIGRADEEFQEQIANGIGESLDTLNEYLDKADVSGVKVSKGASEPALRNNKHGALPVPLRPQVDAARAEPLVIFLVVPRVQRNQADGFPLLRGP